MKKLSILLIIVGSFLTNQARAGNLTVDGNLIVNSNLTAQSITLAGITSTSPGLPIQGYKYVMVAEGTNDTHRGSNLRNAYAQATTLSPSVTNRVAVIIPPGSYNLGANGLHLTSDYVDLIGLLPCQMTTKQVIANGPGTGYVRTVADVQCAVRIYGMGNGVLNAEEEGVTNIRIESVILESLDGVAYAGSGGAANEVLRHVAANTISSDGMGLYTDCALGESDFSNGASGTFVDCVADNFGSGNPASGVFIGCSAQGNSSFGENSTASGTFIRCVGGNASFGGGEDGGGAQGVFVECVGGEGSFPQIGSSAKLRHCKAASGSFGSFNMASDDFNYNVGGANTFLMLPNLPTSTNGLPSGSVYNSGGALKVMP